MTSFPRSTVFAFPETATTPPIGSAADQPAGRTAGAGADPSVHFADRVSEVHNAQQAVLGEFEALLQERSVDAEALAHIGEVMHACAEETDALLALMVRCKMPAQLVEAAEEIFDTLRDAEEKVTEALEWDQRMGRRLDKLRPEDR